MRVKLLIWCECMRIKCNNGLSHKSHSSKSKECGALSIRICLSINYFAVPATLQKTARAKLIGLGHKSHSSNSKECRALSIIICPSKKAKLRLLLQLRGFKKSKLRLCDPVKASASYVTQHTKNHKVTLRYITHNRSILLYCDGKLDCSDLTVLNFWAL